MSKNSFGWSGYLPRRGQAFLLALALIAACCSSLAGKCGGVQELRLTRVGGVDSSAMRTPAP